MSVLRIGRSLQKTIRERLNERLGYRARLEIGERLFLATDAYSLNASLWGDADWSRGDTSQLFETRPLRGIASVDIEENADGLIELDFYCYFPKGHEYEFSLDQNMHVYLKDGEILEILDGNEEIARAESISADDSPLADLEALTRFRKVAEYRLPVLVSVVARQFNKENPAKTFYTYYGRLEDGSEVVLRKRSTSFKPFASYYTQAIATGANGPAAHLSYSVSPRDSKPGALLISTFPVELCNE